MKTAIITGITGQDGPYLAKFLLDKGYKVIGTVRNDRHFSINNLLYLGIDNDIIIEDLDLLDIGNVIGLLQKHQPDEFYNLAAKSSVGLSFSQPIGTFSFNTMSVNNLLESIRLTDIKIKLYQASSSEMYGDVKKLPITIDTPMNPLSPYAVSKMAAHHMAINYRKAYGLFVSNGILFNHESFLRSYDFFIKKVIRTAINIKNGSQEDLKIGNLNVRRDFGYAPKYVEAMWEMLQTKNADDFIICSGKSISLKEIVYYIFDKLNLDRERIIVDKTLYRPNEVHEIVGDNSKAKATLCWDYDYSFFDILDILLEEEMAQHYK